MHETAELSTAWPKSGGVPLLAIDNVSVELPTPRGVLRAVHNVSLGLAAGRTLGIVGESGSGKTMLSRAVAQLLPRRAALSGRVDRKSTRLNSSH